MKPSHSEQVLFAEALQLTAPEAREAYLAKACGNDAALRSRLEKLLRAAEGAGDFLEVPPTILLTDELMGGAPASPKPGDRIGRYKLLEVIGEGGFGMVYMAEQHEPVRRRVALKIIKPGMDSKQVIARFEAERQALAVMDHPNIAKVFDGGTTESGRPYFVMELVRGVRITDYCDEKLLSTEERLKLFVLVCQAVQHAHQKGIIHRDLKPSNILVTVNDGVAVPKVIDFGIAKATGQSLTDKTLFTQFHAFMGTPAYTSPEQAEMSSVDVDTRSDIYSLGVLLYELLTGRAPFNSAELMSAGLDEMRRIIRQVEPPRPSTRLSSLAIPEATELSRMRRLRVPDLANLLRGELDWVVMKCLEKDRAWRYESASGLAADIQRQLNGEPIMARPPSALYRLGKSFKRNKLVCCSAAAVLLALVIGLGVSTTLYFKVRREATKSQRLALFLKETLGGMEPGVASGGDSVLLGEMANSISQNIKAKLKSEPEVAMEMKLVLERVYWDLRAYDKMAETAEEIRRMAGESIGRETLAYADASGYLARALVGLHQPTEAASIAREAIALQRKLRGPDSANEADSLSCLGDALRGMHKLAEAETVTRQALAILRKQRGNDSNEVAWALNSLSIILENEGKLSESEEAVREAIAIRNRISPDKESWPLAVHYERLGRTLLAYGDASHLLQAEEALRKSLAIENSILGAYHPALVHPHFTLAQTLESEAKFTEAASHYRSAADVARSARAMANEEKAFYILGWGKFLARRGEVAESTNVWREAETLSLAPKQ